MMRKPRASVDLILTVRKMFSSKFSAVGSCFGGYWSGKSAYRPVCTRPFLGSPDLVICISLSPNSTMSKGSGIS